MTDQQRFQEKQWSQIVARAWADEAFKGRLVEDPRAVLREHGLELSPEVEVRVCEDRPGVRHFLLPASPSCELVEEELTPVAGTDSFSVFSMGCGYSGRCGCGCDRA